jgi:hypothetical protein
MNAGVRSCLLLRLSRFSPGRRVRIYPLCSAQSPALSVVYVIHVYPAHSDDVALTGFDVGAEMEG